MGARGRRSLPSLAVVAVDTTQRPDPPEALDERERTLWREIVQSLAADYFRPADLPVLVAYCQTVAQHEQATKELRGEALVITADNGRMYRHPLLAVQHTAALRMAALAVKLRLCQSARYGERKAARLNSGAPGKKPWQDGAA